MNEQTRTKILQSTPRTKGIRKLDHKRLRAQLSRAARPLDYDRYMRSKAWQIKRRKFLATTIANAPCAAAKNTLHVHHLHYQTLGKERVEGRARVLPTVSFFGAQGGVRSERQDAKIKT